MQDLILTIGHNVDGRPKHSRAYVLAITARGG